MRHQNHSMRICVIATQTLFRSQLIAQEILFSTDKWYPYREDSKVWKYTETTNKGERLDFKRFEQ